MLNCNSGCVHDKSGRNLGYLTAGVGDAIVLRETTVPSLGRDLIACLRYGINGSKLYRLYNL